MFHIVCFTKGPTALTEPRISPSTQGLASLAEGQLRSSAAGDLEIKSQKQGASPSSARAAAELRLLFLLLVPAQAAAAATLQAWPCLALGLANPDQDLGPQADFHDFPCESG